MGVDKVKFIEDVKKLRQQGVIVYDKEIIATTLLVVVTYKAPATVWRFIKARW